jgi:hypothetical protein
MPLGYYNDVCRGLLAFDLATFHDDHPLADIAEVRLKIYVNALTGANAYARLYECLRAWGATNAGGNWEVNEGGGNPVHEYDPTWDSIEHLHSAWATPGASGAGDRGTDVLGEVLVNGRSQEFTITLNEDGLAAVIAQKETPGSRLGFVVVSSNEGSGNQILVLSSENVTASVRPRLEIDYDMAPGPSSSQPVVSIMC